LAQRHQWGGSSHSNQVKRTGLFHYFIDDVDLKDVQPLVNKEVIKEFISKSDLFEKLVPSVNKILNSVIKT